MKKYYLNEDIRLNKLPIRFSDEIVAKIDDIKFYNRFETENLNEWINDIMSIVRWLSNPVIAWDNNNEFIHNDNGETYIDRYGILFKIMTNKDKQGIEYNFVYVINITLNPQNYNLNVPPYLCENKESKRKKILNSNRIKLNESHIRYILRDVLKQYLQL